MPGTSYAATDNTHILDLTGSWVGIISIIVFALAYAMVISEEFLHLRKSKPVIVAAGIIWFMVGIAYAMHGDTHTAAAIRHNLLEFAELMLFLLAAMYINTMNERQVFSALRAWLIGRGFSLRKIFWITGVLAFFISPLADNLTTALLMGAVVMAVGGQIGPSLLWPPMPVGPSVPLETSPPSWSGKRVWCSLMSFWCCLSHH